MATNKIFCPRGDTRIIVAKCKDVDGKDLDLTNISKVYFSIKKEKTSTDYVLKKKEGAVEGDPLLGIVAFKLLPAETEEKDVGIWWYDIEINFTDGEKYTPIIDNFEILADITRLTYTITASSGVNGSISPTGDVLVESGANKDFVMTPDAGYEIDTVEVDGVATLEYIKVGDVGTYTFTAVKSNHNINVTFKVKA